MINVVNKRKHTPMFNDVYIGRGSVLGNPYTSKPLGNTKAQFQCQTEEESIKLFRTYLINKIIQKDPEICDELNRIYLMAIKHDANLVCYCAPKKCHGDVIKELVEFKINNT